jgi:hypothetical protein
MKKGLGNPGVRDRIRDVGLKWIIFVWYRAWSLAGSGQAVKATKLTKKSEGFPWSFWPVWETVLY